MTEPIRKGDISEWNEGNFKSERLDRAHRQINYFKNRPFVRIDNKWGYEWYFDGIDTLFGEGQDKYTDTEMTGSKTIKEQIEKAIKTLKICSISESMKGKLVSINTERWEFLKKLLEEFEEEVKSYNNKHGYSTRSVKPGGMF